MSDLKPCPCCRSTNLIGGDHADDCVYCKDCFLRAVSPDAWNTRADTAKDANYATLVGQSAAQAEFIKEQAADIARMREVLERIRDYAPEVTHGWALAIRTFARAAMVR